MTKRLRDAYSAEEYGRKTRMTAAEMEQHVRRKWEGPWIYESKRSYHLHLHGREFEATPATKDAAWQAAYDVTIQREKQIAEVEEEIAFLSSVRVSGLTNGELCDKNAVLWRILDRERATLLDLKKGFKP